MALGSLWFLFNGTAPAFGIILKGWQVYVYVLALALSAGALSVALFRLHPLGWWGTVALLVVLGISHVVTYSRIDMLEVYRAAGLAEQQMEVFERIDLSRLTEAVLAQGVAAILGSLGFMVYLRRFFTGSAQTDSAPI
jgi:hypothetical protein